MHLAYKVGYQFNFMLLGLMHPNFGRRYSKVMNVYYTCMKLHVQYVGVQFLWLITSALTSPKIKQKPKIINCRWLTPLESC